GVGGDSVVNLRGHDLAVGAPIDFPAEGEVDRFAVDRPARFGSAAFGVGQQADAGTIGVHDENLVAGVAIGAEGDLGTVGRPGRPAIERGVVAEIAGIGAIAVGNKDFGVHLTEHAAKCYFAAVGRPGRIGVGAAFDQALYFPGFYIHAEDFRVVFPGRLQVI